MENQFHCWCSWNLLLISTKTLKLCWIKLCKMKPIYKFLNKLYAKCWTSNLMSHSGFNESLNCLQHSCISEKYVFWLQLSLLHQCHCLKGFRISSFSGPYFPTFGLNRKIYSVNFCIQSQCGKMWTTKSLNRDTFHAVCVFMLKM